MRTLRPLTVLLTFLLAVGLMPSVVQAQSGSVDEDPGYVDLNRFAQALDMRPNIEVTIKGALLDMVSSRAEREDTGAGRLMKNLRSIQVRGFPTDDLTLSDYDDHLDRFSDELTSEGWDRVMHVREDDQNVSIFMRYNDDAVAGLTMMVSDPSDQRLLFINIVGNIQPDELDTIMGGSGLDMDDVPTPPDNDS